jgi:hypothetical protein
VGRVGYSKQQMAQAVSLGAIIGADAASKQLGMQARSIRNWMARAGATPADAIASADWAALGAMARAQVSADLLAGKVRPKDAAIIGAIADRNAAKPEPVGEESAVAVQPLFMTWLLETVGASLDASGDALSEDALAATVDAIEAVRTELLLRRANAETDLYEPSSPHRLGVLAWFSGRQEIPSADLLDWAKAQVLDVLATYGSLAAWHAHALAEEAAERAERERMAVEIQAKARALQEASVAAAREAGLSPEVRELLDEAHRILRESADA